MHLKPTPYSLIEPLLRERTLSGPLLTCAFACPVSGVEINASIDVRHANDIACRTVRRTSWLRTALRTVLLRNTPDDQLPQHFDEAEIERATRFAFAKVLVHFAWDAATSRYVHVGVMHRAYASSSDTPSPSAMRLA